MRTVYFFYAGNCGLCAPTLEKLLSKLEGTDIRVVVSKPTPVVRKQLPGVPALVVPADVFNLPKCYILVGADMVSWLEQLVSQTAV